MAGSQFEEQIDNNDSVCPYCGDRYQVEAEDYDEDERQDECGGCGKKYWLHQRFSVEHYSRPDCELNGQAHSYERIKLKNGREADFCTVCDDCISVKN